jgi:hypothetical protein
MTRPTVQEFAGIIMLAFATALGITHPVTGSHASAAALSEISASGNAAVMIEGIESVSLPD